MPECGIGLVPDVGGSRLLAQAPGQLGAYLGLTAARIRAGDAIRAGFADLFVPEDRWPSLIANLCEGMDISMLSGEAHPFDSELAAQQSEIDSLFGDTLAATVAALETADSDFAAGVLKSIRRNSPLAMAATLTMLDQLRGQTDIKSALRLEYRFTSRAMEHADFLEGIRAQIIDRDRNPTWRKTIDDITPEDVAMMLAPLGAKELTFEEEQS